MVQEKDIKNTVLYSDYIKFGYIPKTDVLLDWRNVLNEMINEGKFNPDWYKREIMAVDYLLSLKV